ncbi:hypothetical protein KM043_015097 [Ampulex compressa]|nr:hypothetical protein KM043_015097 [Ampulex compressa]
MSLRKFMHPKNKYKKYPDFKLLAIVYPEFQKVASVDLSGEVRLDFKNEESVRVLTEVLLKHDFNLNVKIPKKNLVPTLPLRMNYVLWMEDLMHYASHPDMETVTGIDIGTGAVCIYPLLCAKMYKCHMIATEIDKQSVQTSIEHVKNNNFEDLITVHLVDGQNLLKDVIEDDKVYQFTMCNPPFFDVGENADKTEKELPPRNAPTGSEQELTTEGGEKQFVTKIIEESLEIKDRIKIYTTMVGQKSNLSILIKTLRKEGIQNSTWTEFCQGHTKRWGLAWTFLAKDDLDLTKAPVIRKIEDTFKKISKQDYNVSIMFPMEEYFSSFTETIEALKKMLKDLHIHITELNRRMKDFDGWACQLKALKNTWTHGRKKRRLAQRLKRELLEKSAEAEKRSDSVETIVKVAQADTETNTNDIDVKILNYVTGLKFRMQTP